MKQQQAGQCDDANQPEQGAVALHGWPGRHNIARQAASAAKRSTAQHSTARHSPLPTRLQPGLHVLQRHEQRGVPQLLAHRVAHVEELGILRVRTGEQAW